MPAWRADLHVHTVLSGCAEPEMLPPQIVAQAQAQGLTMLGIADHNSAANTAAVMEAAQGTLVVKPGLEVETRESVHLLCLFDTCEQALSLQTLIYDHLPSSFTEREGLFGPRFLASASGDLLGEEPRPLFLAIDLALNEVLAAAHARGALVLASHVERRAHGLLGVLGFIPPGITLDGLEAGPGGLMEGRVAGSDAHRLSEIGSRYTLFEAAGSSVADLQQALARGSFRTGVVV